MRILDLFCGAGGSAWGIHRACEKAGIRHEIVGVDILEDEVKRLRAQLNASNT